MKIGFICTGNSARSQMAEGYAKHFAKIYGKNIEIYSAGSNPAGSIHPLAIKVMEEDGVSIKDQYSKSLEEIPYQELDLVITLCGDAKESCPYVPDVKMEHWDLPDPAKAQGSEEERLEFFRKVRDTIRKRVEELIISL